MKIPYPVFIPFPMEPLIPVVAWYLLSPPRELLQHEKASLPFVRRILLVFLKLSRILIFGYILTFLLLILASLLFSLFWFVDIYLLLSKLVWLRLLRTSPLCLIHSFIRISYYLIHYEVNISKSNDVCYDFTLKLALRDGLTSLLLT